MILDATPYLVGDLAAASFGHPGKKGLVLVAAESGGLAALLIVQVADDSAYLPDDVLAEQVTVGVVDLLEVVYVGHEHAKGLSRGGGRFERMLELRVEAVLDQQARQVILAYQPVQRAVEVRPHGVPVRILEHRVADEDPVAV